MIRMLLRLFCFAAALLLASTASAAGPAFRDFDAGSFAALQARLEGRPFVLAFWSIHCDPCRDELAQWGPLQRRYPDIPIVLVATDPRSERPVLAKLLSRYDLRGVQSWAYADDFEERVRFAVDRSWRGELPRTYLYDAEHHAEGRSGPAEAGWIEPWLARQSGGKKRASIAYEGSR
jgi:thiol-disulfide isomerase/thioredoxin